MRDTYSVLGSGFVLEKVGSKILAGGSLQTSISPGMLMLSSADDASILVETSPNPVLGVLQRSRVPEELRKGGKEKRGKEKKISSVKEPKKGR